MPSPDEALTVPCAGTVILLRHGQPSDVLPKSFLGHSNPALNALGKQQAQRAAETIGSMVDSGLLTSPATLWSSDLARAQETALPLRHRFSLDLQTSNLIREIDFGDWDGKTFSEVDAATGGAASAWFQDPSGSRPVHGEHLDEVFERVAGFAQNHLSRLPHGETVLVVGHFGSLAMLTAWLLGINPSQALKVVLQRGQCGIIQAGHLRYWGQPHD